MIPPLWIALLLIVAVSAALKDRAGLVTGGALLANWCVCNALYCVTGDQFNWGALFAIDYTTAAILVALSTNRSQVVIACLYVAECCAHIAYASYSGTEAAQILYWDILFYIACLQALIGAGHVVGDAFGLRAGSVSSPSRSLHSGGMAPNPRQGSQ